MADSVSSEMDQLRRENARLIGLLEAHGIAWRSGVPAPPEPAPFGEGDSEPAPAKGPGSTQEKVALFRSLFRGRDDVYALRWQSSSGRSGYAPACANEWRPGLCEKPRISCRDCNHRELQPLSDAAIYGHLAGENTIGLGPCWRTTIATCWPSTLTSRTGVMTPLSSTHAGSPDKSTCDTL